jgi:hypothetical protein
MMRTQDRFQRVLVLLATILATLSAIPVAGTSAASHPLELFVSQQTGYFFFWDPAEWSLAGESSDDGVDALSLQDGDIRYDLLVFPAAGMTTIDCIRNAVDSLTADPSTTSLEALTPEGGPPVVDWKILEVVLTVAEPAGPQKYALRLDCDEAVPGQSLYLKATTVPAAVYNARSMELWEYDPDFFAFQGLTDPSELNRPVSILGDNGEIVGTLWAFISCATTDLFVLAEGSTNEFALNPSAFAVQVENSTASPETLDAWSLPSANREATLLLGSGDYGVLHGQADATTADAYSLFYAPVAGDPVLLASSIPNCGGAGGGAPVLIDID